MKREQFRGERERELYIYSCNYLNLLLFAKRGHNELFNNPIKLLLYPFLQIILVSQREQLFSSTSPVSKYSSTLSREKKYSLYINNTRQISDPFPISDERKSKSLHHRHPSLPKKKKKKRSHTTLSIKLASPVCRR